LCNGSSFLIGDSGIADANNANIRCYPANSISNMPVPQPAALKKVTSIKAPADTALLFDGIAWNHQGAVIRVASRHGKVNQATPALRQRTGRTNVLHLDGHVFGYDREGLPQAAAWWTEETKNVVPKWRPN
jgi:prepilin-type processing-associated H-X9-DG protein